jgi:predicted nuclease of predicted toxin-antitoxin system
VNEREPRVSVPHCRLIHLFCGTLATEWTCFHCDENVNEQVAILLRGRGLDVTTSREAKLCGAADERQLLHAARERRILITNDALHFPVLAAHLPHAGILVCNGGGRFPEEVVRRCLELAGMQAEEASMVE